MMSITSDEPDFLCPDCRRPMISLARYADALENDTLMTSEFSSPFTRTGQAFLFFEIFDHLFNSILMIGHKKKAKRLCSKLLLEYPKSIVCAGCLCTFKRK